MNKKWWDNSIPWLVLATGVAGMLAGLIAGSQYWVLGIPVALLGAFLLWLRRWQRRFEDRIAKGNAESAPATAAIEALSEADARRLIEELIAEGKIIATRAARARDGGMPSGLPESVVHFYSTYERLEAPEQSTVIGQSPIEKVPKRPGHYVVDRFEDWTAGARVDDPRVYSGCEFVEFHPDDSFPSMWHYALFALVDTDELIAQGRIPAPRGVVPGKA